MDLVFALPQANPAAAPDGDHEQEHEDLLDDITVHTAGRAQGGRALVYSDDDDPAEQPPSKRARNHLGRFTRWDRVLDFRLRCGFPSALLSSFHG